MVQLTGLAGTVANAARMSAIAVVETPELRGVAVTVSVYIPLRLFANSLQNSPNQRDQVVGAALNALKAPIAATLGAAAYSYQNRASQAVRIATLAALAGWAFADLTFSVRGYNGATSPLYEMSRVFKHIPQDDLATRTTFMVGDSAVAAAIAYGRARAATVTGGP